MVSTFQLNSESVSTAPTSPFSLDHGPQAGVGQEVGICHGEEEA